jgi:hypothetical protein
MTCPCGEYLSTYQRQPGVAHLMPCHRHWIVYSGPYPDWHWKVIDADVVIE